jgi:uncharacterized surface protein with fasciclin (FAS1) repeats
MLDALLKDIPKTKGILTYHVVAGKVTASKVPKLKMAKTVNSASTSIDAKDGVKINGATVTTADVEASNGVIQIIVTVALPPESSTAKQTWSRGASRRSYL